MLFVNISSDYLHLLDNNNEYFLERNGIENSLGTVILTCAPGCDTILLLNGPGGFTNLRVGTLTLNMMNELLHHDTGTYIPISSITKIDLYTYAYKQGRLPRYGILYIGQKHNVRHYDFQEQKHQQITLENIQYTDNCFLDFVHDPYRSTPDSMISFSLKDNILQLHYKDKTHGIKLEDLNIPVAMTVQPEYLIQPTMN